MYAHVHSNVHSHLKSVTTHSKTVSDGILRDFENLQLSALNKASFRKVYGLMEQKYLGHYDALMNGVLDKCFSYMRKVWIDSSEFRWFQGAHPWHISKEYGHQTKLYI